MKNINTSDTLSSYEFSIEDLQSFFHKDPLFRFIINDIFEYLIRTPNIDPDFVSDIRHVVSVSAALSENTAQADFPVEFSAFDRLRENIRSKNPAKGEALDGLFHKMRIILDHYNHV